jgi:hypothetical protein
MPTATRKRSSTRSTPKTAASQSSAKRNQEVEIYDSWLRGNVFCYLVENEDGEVLDSSANTGRCRISPL